ncbi:hypothetical protein IFR05_002691 [Cadophora sp. M221]|nr:hypothetical protein IFR05_002691 [Cadophora sp. M221]
MSALARAKAKRKKGLASTMNYTQPPLVASDPVDDPKFPSSPSTSTGVSKKAAHTLTLQLRDLFLIGVAWEHKNLFYECFYTLIFCAYFSAVLFQFSK